MSNMTTFRRLALAALAASLASTALAQQRGEFPEFRVFGEAAEETDAQAVDALIRDFGELWGRQDVEGLMALHAADVEWINAYGRMFRGRSALSDFLEARLFPAFVPSVSATEAANMQTLSIRYLGDDAAVVHLYTEGPRGAARDGAAGARRTHVHLVLEKPDERWRIAHTAIMDAR
jgi:uncharacterized protein (TIGR02246 family)